MDTHYWRVPWAHRHSDHEHSGMLLISCVHLMKQVLDFYKLRAYIVTYVISIF